MLVKGGGGGGWWRERGGKDEEGGGGVGGEEAEREGEDDSVEVEEVRGVSEEADVASEYEVGGFFWPD